MGFPRPPEPVVEHPDRPRPARRPDASVDRYQSVCRSDQPRGFLRLARALQRARPGVDRLRPLDLAPEAPRTTRRTPMKPTDDAQRPTAGELMSDEESARRDDGKDSMTPEEA